MPTQVTSSVVQCGIVCNTVDSLIYLLTHALQKATYSCSSCKVHVSSECCECPMQIFYALAKDLHVCVCVHVWQYAHLSTSSVPCQQIL